MTEKIRAAKRTNKEKIVLPIPGKLRPPKGLGSVILGQRITKGQKISIDLILYASLCKEPKEAVKTTAQGGPKKSVPTKHPKTLVISSQRQFELALKKKQGLGFEKYQLQGAIAPFIAQADRRIGCVANEGRKDISAKKFVTTKLTAEGKVSKAQLKLQIATTTNITGIIKKSSNKG